MRELASLAQIARIIAERDLSELARIQSEFDALRESAEDLRSKEHVKQDILATARWSKWKNEELRRIEESRANLASDVIAARNSARRSYGRCVALDELSKR